MFHVLVSTDTVEHDSCLICGGTWSASDNWGTGYITAANGDIANDCTRNVSQGHGIDADNVDPDCNCLYCA